MAGRENFIRAMCLVPKREKAKKNERKTHPQQWWEMKRGRDRANDYHTKLYMYVCAAKQPNAFSYNLRDDDIWKCVYTILYYYYYFFRSDGFFLGKKSNVRQAEIVSMHVGSNPPFTSYSQTYAYSMMIAADDNNDIDDGARHTAAYWQADVLLVLLLVLRLLLLLHSFNWMKCASIFFRPKNA